MHTRFRIERMIKKELIWPILLFVFSLTSCKKDKIDFNDDYVESVEVFAENGGRCDWNPQTNVIVYDAEVDDHWDVFTCSADQSTLMNLTASMSNQTIDGQLIESWHYRGQPAFDETGQYILFQVMNEHASSSLEAEEHLSLGVNNDLWYMTANGFIKQKLTDNPAGYSVLHPKFSHDGSKIMWAEKYNNDESVSVFGSWRIKIADVIINANDSITVTGITDLQPAGARWYETHAFSDDDAEIYFSCNHQTDLKASDLFKYNLQTSTLTNLTNSPSEWEEMYNPNPANSNQYSFISSRFFDWNNSLGWATLRTELYIMDGSEVKQITYYNQRKKDNSKKLTKEHFFIGDHCWSPDGKAFLAILASAKIGGTDTRLLKINLK